MFVPFKKFEFEFKPSRDSNHSLQSSYDFDWWNTTIFQIENYFIKIDIRNAPCKIAKKDIEFS